MRRYGGIFLAVLVTALLGVACSSSKNATSATTTPSSSTSTSAATTSTSSAPPTTNQAQQAKATAAVLQPGDFPAAFKQQPDQGGDCPASAASCSSVAIETVWHDITTCVGVDDTPQVRATSATYLQNLATQARSTVEYTTPAAATAISAALSGDKFKGCATQAFIADGKRNAPPGATPGPPTVVALPAPQVGQSVSAVSATRITVTMNMPGFSPMIVQDFFVITNGATVARFFFLNIGTPFPQALEQSLLQKVVTRAGS